MKLVPRFSAPVLVLCALAGGCSDRPALGTVTGTVTLDGKPLPYGTVTFEAKGFRSATGKIVDGQITKVTTYQEGDGAPVGQHRVAVTANAEPGPAVVANPGDRTSPKGNYMSGKSLIPAAYNDPSTSNLTAEIQKGENTIEIKLSSRGP